MVEPRSEWVVGQPLPPLRPYVERYCGYRMAGFPAGLHRGVPSRHMTLIVSIGPDTPSELLAEDLPSFQDEAASEASSSLS
ncbi:MAG TPA: hypothetical protein VF180_08505 [Acidimicrobiia bacterium]